MNAFKTLQALERFVVARKQDAVDGVQRFAADLAKDYRALRYQGLTALEHTAAIEICDALLAVIDKASHAATAPADLDYVAMWLRDRLISLARDGASTSANPLANIHQAAMTAFVAVLLAHMPTKETL